MEDCKIGKSKRTSGSSENWKKKVLCNIILISRRQAWTDQLTTLRSRTLQYLRGHGHSRSTEVTLWKIQSRRYFDLFLICYVDEPHEVHWHQYFWWGLNSVKTLKTYAFGIPALSDLTCGWTKLLRIVEYTWFRSRVIWSKQRWHCEKCITHNLKMSIFNWFHKHIYSSAC